jgi:transposase
VTKYLKIVEQARETGIPLDDLIPKKGGHRYRIIDPYMEYILTRLGDYPELTAKRLFKEIRKQGFTGSQRTVRRYVGKIKDSLPARVYKPYETDMGEQAQVDWGYEWLVLEDKKIKVYVFAFVLAHSRIRYVEYVRSLDGIVFLNSLHRAFTYIGGIPKSILFDNAKTIVSERVGSTIRFQSDLLQYAATVGFKPKACWVEDPESKGKVESTIGYVRRDFFYGQTFTSFDDLNRKAREWCEEVNNEVHSTTQEIPYEVWLKEKESLRPLPTQEPTIFRLSKAAVTKTCLFSFESNQYSVPKEYARKTVRLEIYEHEFRAYAGENEIGRWPRTTEKGKRFINDHHYEGRFKGAKRSALEQQFMSLCSEAPNYLEGLIESRGSSLREQMEQIITLSSEYSSEELEWSMNRANQFKNHGYDSLKRMIIKQRVAPDSLPKVPDVQVGKTSLSSLDVKVETRDLSYYTSKEDDASWRAS